MSDLGPYTQNREYFLHVQSDGTEVAVSDHPQWARESLRVQIVRAGRGWVDEVTRVFTVEQSWPEPNVMLRYLIVKPHGRGWRRDAKADAHADKWTQWRRRRTWEIT